MATQGPAKATDLSAEANLTPATCQAGFWATGINYFGLAILAGVLVVIVLLPPVQRFLLREFRNPWTRVFVQFVIVVSLIYVANRFMLYWKAKNHYCFEKYQVVQSY